MKAAALEQTLRDHPDDLASWRAYADGFLEQGDARGELIKLAQRHAQARPADRDALEHEMGALVKEHRRSWDAALPPGATVLARRHGFATKVAVEWSDSAPVLIEQVMRAPFVTALRIAPAADESEEYWEEDVDEEPEPTPAPDLDTGALATLNIGRLVELDLSYLRIGAIGAEALAVSTYFRLEASDTASTATRRLEALDLRYARIGDAGLAALAAPPFFSGVRRLHLQRNLLTAEGMRALHRFEGLAELDLRYNDIGAEGAQALLEAPFIGSLRRLQLYRADVGDDGAKMLASAQELPPALRSYWRSV
ncbi:hypothetical protein GCM10023196_087420 [Actinoallomurus vinaceus]|uniref:Uncharacterized protein n=1 Tax=Actinoallomurus vinaceus TaxID=1080074 RepID=A0ABP8URL1_9ACTN